MKLAHEMGFVYKWTNNVNLKWYVGSHKGTPDDGYIAGGKLFWLALKKYGIDNFTRTIVYRGSDYREQEQEILELLDAANDPRSYNMHNYGWGGGSNGMRGKKHTEKTKQLLVIACTGWHQTDQVKQTISRKLKGKKQRPEVIAARALASRGRKVTDKARVNLSLAMKGKKKPPRTAEHRANLSIALKGKKYRTRRKPVG